MLDSLLWPSSNGKTGPPRPTFLEDLEIRDPSVILGGITTTLLRVLAYRRKHLGTALSALARNYGRRKNQICHFLLRLDQGWHDLGIITTKLLKTFCGWIQHIDMSHLTRLHGSFVIRQLTCCCYKLSSTVTLFRVLPSRTNLLTVLPRQRNPSHSRLRYLKSKPPTCSLRPRPRNAASFRRRIYPHETYQRKRHSGSEHRT